MKNIQQKVAYLEGLIKGMELKDAKVGSVLTEIVDILGDIAEHLDILHKEHQDLEDYVESMDSDLSDLEEDFYEDLDDDCVEVECPNCHEVVCFDSSILYADELIEVTCPECNAVVFVNGEEEEYETPNDDDEK